MRLPRRAPAWAFALYTLALLVATHWPGLVVHGPVERTDLVIHAGIYCVWTVLLAIAWPARFAALLAVGIAFAAFDEGTQPLFDRTFDALDLAADAVGVALGAAAAVSVRRLAARGGPGAEGGGPA